MLQRLCHVLRSGQALTIGFVIVGATACSTPQVRYDRTFYGDEAINLSVDESVQIDIKRITQRPGFVELDVDIINQSDHTELIMPQAGAKNSSIQLISNGQTAIAESRPGAIALWCGYFDGSVKAVGEGLSLGPQSRLGLVLRFNWDTAIEREEPYEWELSFGGIYELGSDQALPTLRHRYPGD